MGWSLIAVLILGAVARGNGQCDGKEMIITSGNGEISSPNYPNEYGITANCSWKFTPSDGYSLVLTLTYQRLYIVKNFNKFCLESYSLTINNDTQGCVKYIDAKLPTTLIEPFEYFDTMCGGDKEDKPSVLVQYISDGRTYTGSENVQTAWVGFSIRYRISECPSTAETTTDHVLTSIFEGSSYIEQTGTTFEDNRTLSTTKDTTGETDGANSGGISDTTKLFLVSIPGFIGIIILVVTAIVFFGKKGGKSQDGKNVEEKENVGRNQMENAESAAQEPEQDTASAEQNEPTTSTIREEEAPYTIMLSTLARKDEEDKKETIRDGNRTSAIEEDEHKYDMYSAVVRKTEGGDKETIHV